MEIYDKQAEQEFYLLDGWDDWLDFSKRPELVDTTRQGARP